jgi:hypothetical protein
MERAQRGSPAIMAAAILIARGLLRQTRFTGHLVGERGDHVIAG